MSGLSLLQTERAILELKRHFDIAHLNQVKQDIQKRLIDLNKTKTDDNAMYTAMTSFRKTNE